MFNRFGCLTSEYFIYGIIFYSSLRMHARVHYKTVSCLFELFISLQKTLLLLWKYEIGYPMILSHNSWQSWSLKSLISTDSAPIWNFRPLWVQSP